MSQKNKKRYGSGLENILETVKSVEAGEELASSLKFREIALDQLHACRFQPRKQFDEQALLELSSSIRQQGLLQPILVRQDDIGYEIIAGERRWRASKLAGNMSAPCVIIEAEDQAVVAYTLIENIQREALNPIEEAEALKNLIDSQGITHIEAAEIVGKSRSRVTNMLRLLGLHLQVKQMLSVGLVDTGHARALLSLEKDQQVSTANEIVKRKLSVRQAEALVSSLVRRQEQRDTGEYDALVVQCNDLRKRLSQRIKKKTAIKPKAGGRVVVSITFEDIEQAEQFCCD